MSPVRVEAEQKAVEILEEMRSQQRLARGGVQGVRVSLPLSARAAAICGSDGRGLGGCRPGRVGRGNHSIENVDVKDTPPGTALTGELRSGGWERALHAVALTNQRRGRRSRKRLP